MNSMEQNVNVEEKEEKTKNDTPCEENTEKKEKKLSKKERELTDKIKALEEEAKENADRYLRMAAEYDNFRRRSKEEKDATYQNALADTVAQILPIIDNLERAVQCDAQGALKEGLDMIMTSCKQVLDKLGVSAFGEVGEEFNPNIHNAIMHEENEEFGENVISAVFQKGYRRDNKIIRFAMVKTAN